MPSDIRPSSDLARYARQIRFAPLGEEGQRRLNGGKALLCGCGALGSAIANLLVRAGVGMLRIVDRDFVELGNLQRQTLFDEADAAAALPKAVAAAEKLRKINSTVAIEPIVADIGPTNIRRLCDGVDLLLDGTDNFETRMLINDAAVKFKLPWIYGGCVGGEGQSMTILPGETACLRCLMPECPRPGSTATCESAGILGPIVGVIASIEAGEAMKILSGNRQADFPPAVGRRSLAEQLSPDRRQPAARAGRLPGLQGRRILLALRPATQPHRRALRPQLGAVVAPRREHLARRTGREAGGRGRADPKRVSAAT